MNKKLALILAALLALISWSAMAQDEPLPAAAYVPEGSMYLHVEWDDGLPEYRYLHEETDMVYEVTLHPENDELIKLKNEHLFMDGGKQVTLSEEEVLSKLYERFPDALQVTLHLDHDDGLYVYKAKFATLLFAAEAELHPETGMLLEMKLDYTRPLKEAADMGEKQEQNKAAESKAANKQQENKVANEADVRISKDRARQIAIDKAGGGNVYGLGLDRDDGRWVYDGEVIYGDYEYEFEIDAESGKMIQWDRERRDRDD